MKPENTKARRASMKRAAFRSVLFFALLQTACAVFFGSLCLIPGLPRWTFWMFFVLSAVYVMTLVPALVVLKQRFQEIEGGELDEAGKY